MDIIGHWPQFSALIAENTSEDVDKGRNHLRKASRGRSFIERQYFLIV